MRIIYMLLGLLFFVGCANMQLSSSATRANVDKLSADTIEVTFCGNAYMSQQDVEKYALQRASTESLSKGCPYFFVVKKDDRSKFCSLGASPGSLNAEHMYAAQDPARNPNVSGFVEPNVTLTIRCIKDGKTLPPEAINAQEYLDKNFPGLKK